MSGTQVDARIPLAAGPAQNVGPNLQTMLQNTAGMDTLYRQNALRSILGKEGTIDTNGMVTPDALRQIGGVDPQAAVELGKNNLVQQQRKMQMDVYRSDAFHKQSQYINDALAPIHFAYKKGVEEGKIPEPILRKQAQEAWTKAVEGFQTGGFLDPNVVKTIDTTYDPAAAEQRAQQVQSYHANIKELQTQRHQAQQDARAGEETVQLPDGRVVYSRPNDPDPNKRLTDKDGNPVSPADMKGARKLGTAPPAEIPGRAAEHDAMIRAEAEIKRKEAELGRPLTEDEKAAARQTARADPAVELTRRKAATSIADDTPEQRESRAAQAATGQPLTAIVSGYRGEAVALRERTRQDAIKRIQDELGVGPADAGIELANRTIEYQAGKRSTTQLTTMLGATRQAAGQLDFNIDKAKEEMAKLPSSDLSPIINAIMRGAEKWSGDPAYAGLFYYMHAVAVESARILSGGQASIAQLHQGAMDEARKWANENMTPASFNEVAHAMKLEGRGRIKTFEEALKKGRVGPKDKEDEGAPAIPASLQKMHDAKTLVRSPDGKMFYDNGTKKFYDGSGKETAPPQAPGATAPASPAAAPTQAPSVAPPVGTAPANAPVQIPPAPGPRAQQAPAADMMARQAAAPSDAAAPAIVYTPNEKQKADPEGTVYKDKTTGQRYVKKGDSIVSLPSDDPAKDVLRAKEAIQMGAPKDKVIALLKSGGVTDEMIKKAGIE